MTDQELVLSTLDEYAEAYCAKDLDRLMAIFVDGESISLIGTGADELCSGRSAVASVFVRNFNDATATRFEWVGGTSPFTATRPPSQSLLSFT